MIIGFESKDGIWYKVSDDIQIEKDEFEIKDITMPDGEEGKVVMTISKKGDSSSLLSLTFMEGANKFLKTLDKKK